MQKYSALSEIKVLDFTWLLFGPLVTKYLADHGAKVVKVESTTRIDLMRLFGPYKDNDENTDASGQFFVGNSSKYSITVNLRNPNGAELIKKLVCWADVITENFGPGTMRKLGFGYEQLKTINPKVIMISLSLFGQSGELADFKGFGPHIAAFSGVYALSGWSDDPTAPPVAWPDVVGPWFAVIAILSALEYRRRTGKGQWIDLSQAETMIQGLGPAMVEASANGRVPARSGNRHSDAAPHGVYPCKGEDRWIAIAIFSVQEWVSFCEVMGKKELTKDGRFSTLQARKQNEDELDFLITGWTKRLNAEEVMNRLQAAGIRAGVVQNGRDIMEFDPQIKHRNYFQLLEHPSIGKFYHPAWPAKLSLTPATLRHAPRLGEHNVYVCKHFLGLSDGEIRDLVTSGAIG